MSYKFEYWSKSNCEELIHLVKDVIDWEDPIDVANDLLKIAMDLKAKGSPQAETYKKAHELAMENIYEGLSDPFKNALESNNPKEIVSKSLYMIVDKYCQWGNNSFKTKSKDDPGEVWFISAFAQVEIIYRAFNLLSCDTFALYQTTISSKVLPARYPDSHEKIKGLIDKYFRNKQIQVGVIEPLSIFLMALLFNKNPDPKLIVKWLDGNVSKILIKVLSGRPNEAVEMCKIYKESLGSL